ncbi:acetyl esterase/lipase [Sphingomonas sp. PP-F2F-A104-K0414]|uniref:alpha/beta hydrolase n=1 Tax=Sphingomonas sp. PP-F2F-A104-K0414 TaxID=2135661 RepID=UPI0010493C0A|nr:alpha/beta hydrolase [Sphingomonas sp. PP-F2F-A104-K0414]TCP96392.1 acetyl esterase/lipase [Sphingomonas sp. PP-F2F-A104-K0414]
MAELNRRTVVQAGIAAAFAAPITAQSAASASAPAGLSDAEVLGHVHPQLRALAAQVQAVLGKAPPLSDVTLAQTRAGFPALVKPPLADVPWSETRIPGSTGQPAVTVFVINAKPGQSRPAILYTHGGGFVSGRTKDYLFSLQGMAKTLDCAIVAVEYRLAPETRWSGSVEDNYAGLKWLHANSGQLGVDVRRIAVMGESAGGGHAALLAIVARDRGEVPIAFQCLVYPMLDDRTGITRRIDPPIGSLVWGPAANRYGWQSFLGQAPGETRAPPAVPARIKSVVGLPPAWIGVGSIDLFVHEDIEYAGRLIDANIPTELVVVPGAFHGFDSLPEILGLSIPVVKQFNDAKITALRNAFAN